MIEIKMVIKQRKWKWLELTLRKGPGDITKQSPRWKRKAGRPMDTWRRELEKERNGEGFGSTSLASLTADKKNWRHKA